MRKRKKGRKLSRKRAQRKALLTSLARSLFLNEKIRTTEAKAKEVSRFAEKMITKAKNDNLHARRLLNRFFSQEIVKKLVDDIAKRYKERKGGYTRIIKFGLRQKDGAKLAFIELIKEQKEK